MEVSKIKQKKKKEKKQQIKKINQDEEPIATTLNIETEIQEASKDTPSCSIENIEKPQTIVSENVNIESKEEPNAIPSVSDKKSQKSIMEPIISKSENTILHNEDNKDILPACSSAPEIVEEISSHSMHENKNQDLKTEQKQICEDEQICNELTKICIETVSIKVKDSNNLDKTLRKTETTEYVTIKTEPVDILPRAPLMNTTEIYSETLKIHPLTESQLSELHRNEELELATNQFIHEFIKTELSSNFEKKHYLYELLMKYIQSKTKLTNTDLELKNGMAKCLAEESNLWITKELQVSQKGECHDGNTVSVVQNYSTSTFQQHVYKELMTSLSDVKNHLHEDYQTHTYLCQVVKLQIDYCIQCIISECQNVANVSQETPVQLIENALPLHLIQDIRMCLSVLFYFQRRNVSEKSFVDDTRNWIEKLVSVLLRVASWRDHLFLLHHILRCPAGVSNWATYFIQAPCPPIPITSSPFSDSHINHIVTVVATILFPIQQREVFLLEFLAKDVTAENMWVVVDSDGEDEAGESENACPMRENDIVALLNQIPFGRLFRNLTRVSKKDGQDILNLDDITENYLLTLFAWSSHWIHILGCGIRTYSTPRYRQLIKLLSRFINYTIQYITEIWILFCTHNTYRIRDEALMKRLQVEYDALLLKATQCIYSSQRQGAWQFLAILPFEAISQRTLWILYFILHNGCVEDIEFSSVENSDKTEIHKQLNSTSLKQNFEESISKLPDAEVYYLLQTFANMALSRKQEEWDFIQLATISLLQIGFVCASTRENNSKHVRDLLISLTVKYPNLISTIIKYIQEHIWHMGQLCLYLFKELPLHMWVPTEEDFELLARQLIHTPIISFENNLVRLILAHLNWDFYKNENNDEMFLPAQLHLRTALLLVTASSKHYLDGLVKGSDVCMIWDTWVWKFVVRLRLHIFDRDSRTIYFYFNDPATVLHDIPENHSNLFSALKDKQPLASFISLLTTQSGHSVPLICDHGFILMQNLISSTRYNEVICALHLIIPIFLSCEDSLLQCDRFKNVITALFNADRGYVKMAKNLIIANEPGPVIKQFGNMIQSHLSNHKRYFLDDPGKFIVLWLRIITSIEGWNKESNYIYIVDIILRSAFFCGRIINEVFNIFRDILKIKNDPSKIEASSSTGISSIFSWMSSSTIMPTLLPTISENSVWLSYFILELEYIEFEVKPGVWKELLIQIAKGSGKTNIDNSLKKAAEKCKYLFFGSKFLSIYRWAQQALDAPLGHPILVLLWQKFFTLYLFRTPATEKAADRGSVGKKFFDGVVNINFLRKVKRRLQESIDYFSTKSEECQSRMNDFIQLESLFKTFILWLEEPRLHEPGLYLHLLPPVFIPQKLLTLFEGSSEPWLEYVNYEQVLAEQKLCNDEWISNCYRNQIPRVVSPTKNPYNRDDYLKNLLRRLNSYDTPQPPPRITPFVSLIPPLSPDTLLNKTKLMSLLKSQVNYVNEFAQDHVLKLSQHTALDCAYGELLPQLYKVVSRTVKMTSRCNAGRNSQNASECSGPAVIYLKIDEWKINENILHQIHSNRSEYNGLLKRCFSDLPQEFCSACVFIEHVNNILLSEFVNATSNSDNKKIEIIQKVAADCFYFIISVLSDEIKLYAPAKLLFSSCITRLGKTFITGWDNETTRLLNIAIQKPKLIDMLSSLLDPPINGIGFLNGYRLLVQHINNLPPETIFTFLSKFNVKKWLVVKKPRLSERSEILSVILHALMDLGLTPNEKFNILHELLRSHLILVFCHEWPEHYGEVLQAVLHASSTSEDDGGCISILVWKDLLNTLGYRNNPSQSFTEELRHYATTQKLLKHCELLESVVLLGHHFTQERLKYGLYGLYPRYRAYVEPITTLLAMFGHALVVSIMQKYPGLLADELYEMIWPALKDMFSPWLTPYWTKSLKDASATWIQQLTDGRAAVLPWIHADTNHAQKVINAFVNNIRFITEMLPACNSILNHVWQFYVNNFVHSAIKDHVLSPVHSALLTLSWERFWPSLHDLETMLKVVDQYLPQCHVFTGCIAVRIPWVSWLNIIGSDNASTPVIRTQQCLLPLLIKLAHEPAVQQQNSKHLQALLSQAFRFNWNQVNIETYEQLINWYVMSGDPRAVLRGNDKVIIDYLILDVLRASAEYIPSGIGGKLGFYAQAKRRVFIRGYTRLLTSTANRYKHLVASEDIKFRATITEVFEDMENILNNNAVNVENKMVEVYELLEEFLIIADDKNLTLLFTETLTEWISNRTEHSLVLQGVLSVLGTTPQCPIATSTILDAALIGYFNLPDAKWDIVTKLLKGRNLWTSRKLPEIMAQNGNILALHSIILICKTDETISLFKLVEWITNLKLNKTIEARLPLIWYDVLDLIMAEYHKSSANKDEKSMAELLININKFTICLNKIADEKSGWGSSFLGAMRIRNNTDCITKRCRFLCKTLAMYVNAQINEKHSGDIPTIRCCGELLQAQELNLSGIENLLPFSQGELKVCAEIAIKQIQDVNNSLHNSTDFIILLSQQLYNERYLKID